MRAGLALIVFVIDVVALASVFGTRMALGRRIAWIAAVLLAPFAGALAWLAIGRRRLAVNERDG